MNEQYKKGSKFNIKSEKNSFQESLPRRSIENRNFFSAEAHFLGLIFVATHIVIMISCYLIYLLCLDGQVLLELEHSFLQTFALKKYKIILRQLSCSKIESCLRAFRTIKCTFCFGNIF